MAGNADDVYEDRSFSNPREYRKRGNDPDTMEYLTTFCGSSQLVFSLDTSTASTGVVGTLMF
jgi:hypothetical protein